MNTTPSPAVPVEAQLFDHLKDAFINPKDNPALPRVLLIGDSISIGYTVPVREYFQNKANVHRPKENCQHSAYHLKNVKTWLGDGKWDVIHFNCGIWDTHYMVISNGTLVMDESNLVPGTTKIRHTHAEYRANLIEEVKLLQATGARVIFATSTPIPGRKGARFEDVRLYNEVAKATMKELGVPVNDLYEYVMPHPEWYSDDQCHFNNLGNQNLGKKVGDVIAGALKG